MRFSIVKTFRLLIEDFFKDKKINREIMLNIAKMRSLKDYGMTVPDKIETFDFIIWPMPPSKSLLHWRSPV